VSLSIAAAALDAPGAPALLWAGQSRSYAQLAAEVARLVPALRSLGVGRGDRVCVRAENRPEVVTLLLALVELGATFVPIHPRLSQPEATALERLAEPSLSLDDQALLALASAPPAPASAAAHEPPPHPGADEPLAILFTSGTTGQPRGAVLSRRAFVAAARASEANLGWAGGDGWILCMPVCHVGGLSIVSRCLMARKRVVLLPRFDPGEVLAAVASGNASLLSVVPTMLHRLLADDRANALARLRAVLVGGAACPAALLEECARRRVPALTTYGLTEACSQVTSQRPRDPALVEPGSGVALPGTRVWIASDEGDVLPHGSIGRIRVETPASMDGYWRGPPAPGALDTGDLGSIDEQGRLFVHARRTDLIVTGGENVYPAEVEQALVALPGVSEAVVFGVPDPIWGQVVAAAIVPTGARGAAGELDARVLAQGITAALAPHRRPRLLCYVAALPLKGPGKVDRAGAAAAFSALLRPLPR
jgi:o-succinylbenzoate---CoA ligase